MCVSESCSSFSLCAAEPSIVGFCFVFSWCSAVQFSFPGQRERSEKPKGEVSRMDYHPPTGATEGQTAPYDSNVLEISRFSQNPFLALFNLGNLLQE